MTRSARFRAWQLPVLAAVAAAILLVAGVGMALYEETLYSEQQVKDTSEQAQILAASVTAAIMFDDQNAAQEYVDALKVNPELQAAAVYDRQGQLLAKFARGGAPAPGHPALVGVTVANGAITVLAPVIQRGDKVGTVYLRAMTESAARRFTRYAGLILLISMGALVLGVLGFAQAALTRVNDELESRAGQLALINARLQDEMAERRKTEEALRQSHKMEAIGQLSGGIAHDFNNLITIVKGNLRLLRRRLAQGGGDTDRYFESAETGLDRAASLTQRILAFSRRQPLSPKPVQLSALVSGMHDLIRHSTGDKVEIRTGLESRWWTLCDVNQMENVVLNIAINARDAMPEGGVLTITSRDIALDQPPDELEGFVPGDYVELVLRDTGTGMSEETRQRAVDPFFTTKPQGKGTGLGLSMTFGYVRQSDGHLVIESAPGQGTAIIILMPRYEEPETGA
ncbi:MAG TPA: CHASE sensor domain-containing protein [Rhizomicrobium sp.]